MSLALEPRPAAGRWAVGVSGGADSVALLFLLHRQPGLLLHVGHLNHQTRGRESDGDADFVAQLAGQLSLPCTVMRREELEPAMSGLPANPSARFRAVRMELFARIVQREKLLGVILGHHGDDQAETILLRLLRGSGPEGLAGMKPLGRLRGMTVLRPLLHARRSQLVDFLRSCGQSWREDASNRSPHYARNRIRQWLGRSPQLFQPVLELGSACGAYLEWLRRAAPQLEEEFAAAKLARLPGPVARQSARRWLMRWGAAEQAPAALDRLCQMAADAATPPRQQFAGGLEVRRRGGWISCQSPRGFRPASSR